MYPARYYVMIGCAFIIFLGLSVSSILGASYFITISSPGWDDSTCKIKDIDVVNNTCDLLDIWATSQKCTDYLLMRLPSNESNNIQINQTLDCFINPNCSLFELSLNGETEPKNYVTYIIILFLISVFFMIVGIFTIFEIVGHYTYVRNQQLERLLSNNENYV